MLSFSRRAPRRNGRSPAFGARCTDASAELSDRVRVAVIAQEEIDAYFRPANPPHRHDRVRRPR